MLDIKNLGRHLDKKPKQYQNVDINDNTIDIDVGEGILNDTFDFIKENIGEDSDIGMIEKATILFYLPGTLNGAKKYIRRNPSRTKILLDKYQMRLQNRK